jgi:hypothetical protein
MHGWGEKTGGSTTLGKRPSTTPSTKGKDIEKPAQFERVSPDAKGPLDPGFK